MYHFNISIEIFFFLDAFLGPITAEAITAHLSLLLFYRVKIKGSENKPIRITYKFFSPLNFSHTVQISVPHLSRRAKWTHLSCRLKSTPVQLSK